MRNMMVILFFKAILRFEGEKKAGLGLHRREQKKSAPIRGVDGLMQPVPAHIKLYRLH
jgi:hypothetical protein